MRIGVITTSYPRWLGDPAGNFVAELTHWLLDSGHEVEVLAGAASSVPDRDTDAWQRARVVRVPAARGLFYRGGAPDSLSSPRAGIAAFRYSARLVREVRARAKNYDGIVAHWLAPSALAAVLGAPAIPICAIAHGGDVHLLAKWRLAGLAARVLDRPNVHLHFVSRASQTAFLGQVGGASPLLARSQVCSMGINLKRFHKIAASRTRGPVPTILFVGRLVPVKGVDVLLEALAGLGRPHQVVIAGAGPAEMALRQQARRLGVVVSWRGAVGVAERDRLLGAADLVVVCSREFDSRTEGMPLIAFEALAAGAQLLVTDSGGLSEIPSSICHRVAAGEAGALRAAIRRIIDGVRAPCSPADWLEQRSWEYVAPRLLANMI